MITKGLGDYLLNALPVQPGRIASSSFKPNGRETGKITLVPSSWNTYLTQSLSRYMASKGLNLSGSTSRHEEYYYATFASSADSTDGVRVILDFNQTQSLLTFAVIPAIADFECNNSKLTKPTPAGRIEIANILGNEADRIDVFYDIHGRIWTKGRGWVNETFLRAEKESASRFS